jgi:uronate dehydrogenase
MHVLITGAAGLIGRQLSQALQSEHTLRLADVRPPTAAPPWVQMDVTDLREVEQAIQDVEAVVHLAVVSGYEGDYEDDALNQRRFDVHVKGTANVLEAARRAGVRRFVHTSSLTVAWGYPPPAWVESDAPARPVGTYALTKHLGEAACEYYARQHGLSVVCLRIPKPVDLEDDAWKQRKLRPQWIAFPDLIQAYRLALTAPEIGFEIVTVVGESRQRRWDLSKAERLLGYRPTLRLEELGYDVGDENEALPGAV